MRRGRWLAVGTVVYMLILIATAPATLVDGVLRRASAGRLQLAEARGTAWSGAGRVELLDASRQAGIAKYIAWHLSPVSLLSGRIVCEVELDSPAKRFVVSLSPSRIELTDAHISVPAASLGIVLPKLAPFGLGGDLQAHIVELVIAGGAVQANATVLWRAASSIHSRVSPLGNYELRFANPGAAMTAVLRTLDGVLQLDGSGTWAKGAMPAFQATARVAPQQREQLEPLLRMIAVERGAGNYELRLP